MSSNTRLRLCVVLVFGCIPHGGCAALQDITQAMEAGEPGADEIARGLRQALSKGAGQAVAGLAREGGFLDDPLVRIPFPEEAKFAADALNKIGLGSLVESLEKRLNRGAEAGAQRALPIFEDAVRQMSFTDVEQVLFGGEHAATEYFRAHTFDALAAEFRPEIQAALDEVGATGIWSELSTRYNSIPLTSKKVETDIVHYATVRALDGMFVRLAEEEARIRVDPIARTTHLLQRVFGYAASRAQR